MNFVDNFPEENWETEVSMEVVPEKHSQVQDTQMVPAEYGHKEQGPEVEKVS